MWASAKVDARPPPAIANGLPLSGGLLIRLTGAKSGSHRSNPAHCIRSPQEIAHGGQECGAWRKGEGEFQQAEAFRIAPQKMRNRRPISTLGYAAAGKASQGVTTGDLPSFMIEETFRRRRRVENMLNLMSP